MSNIEDKVKGTLIGLAVGDAVGTSVEFMEKYTFKPLTDMIGGGVFKLEPGQWTDDTSMALCLADSILAHDTIDPTDVLNRFVNWYRNGHNSSNGTCFDIGNICLNALLNFEDYDYIPAKDLSFAAGNGSIMRLAPVAMRWYKDKTKLIKYSRLQSLATHGAKECLEACDTLAEIISNNILGIENTLEDYTNLSYDDVPNSGYVKHTMQAAIWSFQTTDDFRDCILTASNLGGDADTIAAVAGQIAGSYYGLSSIPIDWIEKLAYKYHLLDISDSLYQASV